MEVSIGKHFNMRGLLKFAFPSIAMMVFMSLYTIIDGMFVAQFIGSEALSAINIVYPVISVFVAIGVMISTGGSAIIAKKMGENNVTEAREDLTFLTLSGVVIGIVLGGISLLFLSPLLKMLGAEGDLVAYCSIYLKVLLYFVPLSILQIVFMSFFITASKPGLGFVLTLVGGIVNMIFDYVFLGILHFGIEGAAIATGMGQMIPALVGVIYFSRKSTLLRFKKCKFLLKTFVLACANGSSEMVSNLSTAIVTLLFNIIMMRLVGSEGVAAITIVLYGQFLFNSLYLGYSMGVAPIFSFHYGANNKKEVQNIFKKSMWLVCSTSVAIAMLSICTAKGISEMFVPKNTKAYELASVGCVLFSLNYFFSGFNIFVSSLFTAFSDGKSSAIISFFRTFLCMVVALLVLPFILGTTGVWLAVPLAETITLMVSLKLLVSKNKRYEFLKEE